MSANIGILLPQNRATSRRVLIVAIVAALMAAAALATVLALRSNGSADVAGSGVSQVQNAGQAVPNYQSWLQAQQDRGLPAIVRFRAQASASSESALSGASAHLREIAGRRNFSSGSASTSSTSSDSELCPFGKRGPC